MSNTLKEYVRDSLTKYSSKFKDYFVRRPTSTDNAIARYDDTIGQIQDSLVTITDTGEIGSSTGLLHCNVPASWKVSTTKIYKAIAGYYRAGRSTGAIVLKMPDEVKNKYTMATFTITGFDYYGGSNGKSWKVECGGYMYANGRWINNFVRIYGNAPFTKVTLSRDSTTENRVIVLGEIDTRWSYASFVVDMNAAYSHTNGYDSPWSVTLSTDLSNLDAAHIYIPKAILVNRNILAPMVVYDNGSVSGVSNVRVSRDTDDGRHGHISLYTSNEATRKMTLGYGSTDGKETHLKMEGGTERFVIQGGDLWLEGYTRMGGGPYIKTKVITGYTSGTVGGTVSHDMGFDKAKVLDFAVTIDEGTYLVKDNYDLDGFRCRASMSGSSVVLKNATASEGDSSSILNKPFRILITYEK